MKTTAAVLGLAFLFTVSVLFPGAGPAWSEEKGAFGGEEKKDGEKKDGEKKEGSKFGEEEKKDGEKKDAVPDEPVPKTYSLSDYRLEFTLDDSRFWKHDTNYTDKEVEQGVCLKLVLKLPKSDDHFDVSVFAQGVEHKMTMTWNDGTKIGAENFKALADKHFEDDMKEWKEVKDIVKPRTVKLAKDLGKVYTYEFTGMTPGGAYPLHKCMYYIKFKDKTYMMNVTYTTTSHKNKAVRDAIDNMLKSFKAKKKSR